MTELPRVTIYTDGSCLGNPGPGGYAAVLLSGPHRKELAQGFSGTTNNRMEIMAVIAGLESLKTRSAVEIVTDSQYVKKAFTDRWLAGWQKNGWKTAAKQPVKNQDLWKRLVPLIEAHEVKWRWVRGHSGDPENERCDQLARGAASGRNLPPDQQG
ncbi:RNase HI [Humidesulfovibrio mexicanus]|uniref:Ribonuclease H n=1 Tax=Humidesulfovibrio mexicanus TaxID=147047 RepID=A0A239AR31_9BACT|nr:ribonuclease HI [Humidesulfovibrio mexicanus]SNR98009.1 RNase HI [Humidesulfovibrio mexicanus]